MLAIVLGITMQLKPVFNNEIVKLTFEGVQDLQSYDTSHYLGVI